MIDAKSLLPWKVLNNLTVGYLYIYDDTNERIENIVITYFKSKNIPVSWFRLDELYSGFEYDNKVKILNLLANPPNTGKPDLVIEVPDITFNKTKLVFVEVKSKTDSYPFEQMCWVKDNPGVNVLLLFVIKTPTNYIVEEIMGMRKMEVV